MDVTGPSPASDIFICCMAGRIGRDGISRLVSDFRRAIETPFRHLQFDRVFADATEYMHCAES